MLWGAGLSCGVQRRVLLWATGTCVEANVSWDLRLLGGFVGQL